jgi:hypothetical protein
MLTNSQAYYNTVLITAKKLQYDLQKPSDVTDAD